MNPHVFIGSRKLVLRPQQLIGRGGEAEVYDIGGGRALKLYKPSDHPDYALSAQEQQAARDRLSTIGAKLRAMPRALPESVVRPEELATDRGGAAVLGYTMRLISGAEPLLRYGEPTFRRAGASNAAVLTLFCRLRDAVASVHAATAVIGDFNDLNVLVRRGAPHLIDADSFQYGPYECRVFTERFIDPLRLEPRSSRAKSRDCPLDSARGERTSGVGPRLARPPSPDSDWYAFAAMLLQSLLFVGPYGGIHRPKGQKIPASERPLRRITVFHPEVQYPKPASRPETLPDDLLGHLHKVLEQNDRTPFPAQLLQPTRWSVCPSCGVEHARTACPSCRPHASAPLQRLATVRGAVTARRVFSTEGVILFATAQGGRARWLYHHQGALRREDGTEVLRLTLDPSLHLAIQGDTTLVARGGELLAIRPGVSLDRMSVDACGGGPSFAAIETDRFWAHGGTLFHQGPLGPETVGEVLEGQTRLWVGGAFGLGFFRAGGVEVGFIVRPGHRGLNDSVKLPRLPGTLIEARCEFSDGLPSTPLGMNGSLAFLLRAAEHRGRVIHQCAAVDRKGAVVAVHEAERGDGSWLARLEGKCAVNGFLLAATDAGLHRIEVQAGGLTKTRDFPDCEPFVDERSWLLVDRAGVVAVRRNEVVSLQMS